MMLTFEAHLHEDSWTSSECAPQAVTELPACRRQGLSRQNLTDVGDVVLDSVLEDPEEGRRRPEVASDGSPGAVLPGKSATCQRRAASHLVVHHEKDSEQGAVKVLQDSF